MDWIFGWADSPGPCVSTAHRPAQPRSVGWLLHPLELDATAGNPTARRRAVSLGFGASPLSGRRRCRLRLRLRLGAVARSCLFEAARYARKFPFRISVALTRDLDPPPLRLPAKRFLLSFGLWLVWMIMLPFELIDLMAGSCS
jgi:hypothetical protein